MKIYKLKNLDFTKIKIGDMLFNKNDGEFYTLVGHEGTDLILQNENRITVEVWENVALLLSSSYEGDDYILVEKTREG